MKKEVTLEGFKAEVKIMPHLGKGNVVDIKLPEAVDVRVLLEHHEAALYFYQQMDCHNSEVITKFQQSGFYTSKGLICFVFNLN
ncbi:hypothetical protein [Persicobacter psychrovividus]|uniref:Uncharacterized protein n=1 Tax=Persicobacter psychrovividus TaxID=387638 RepID=A0ABN6LIZ9_9BACT|nr:hypothetical protein PEPS_38420 [Persicobacter psychrovividus]